MTGSSVTEIRMVRIGSLLLILLGFSLRLYRLDTSSLWNDEAGQAVAAAQPTMSGMLSIIRSHAMAMPLDYVLTRFVLHLGSQEFLLRFASVGWAILSLGIYFRLIAQAIERRTAFLTLLLLTFSPLHLFFSQEMRFYSALIFFFGWASYLLFQAFIMSSLRRWLLFGCVVVVGCYFHIYVLFSLFVGWLYIFVYSSLFCRFMSKIGWNREKIYRVPRRVVVHFSVCTLAIGSAVLLGYFYFGDKSSFAYPLLQYGGTISHITAVGLGFKSRVFNSPTIQWQSYEIVKSLLFCATLGLLLRRNIRLDRRIAILLVSMPLIIGAIIGADMYKGYWYLARQLVFLEPIVLIIIALGLSWISYQVERLGINLHGLIWNKVQFFVGLIPSLLLLLLMLPRVSDVYHYPKSNAREAIQQIRQESEKNAMLLVIPGYETKMYQFYLMNHTEPTDPSLIPVSEEWNGLSNVVSEHTEQALFLVAPTLESTRNRAILKQLGFSEFYQPLIQSPTMRSVFLRKAASRLSQ